MNFSTHFSLVSPIDRSNFNSRHVSSQFSNSNSKSQFRAPSTTISQINSVQFSSSVTRFNFKRQWTPLAQSTKHLRNFNKFVLYGEHTRSERFCTRPAFSLLFPSAKTIITRVRTSPLPLPVWPACLLIYTRLYNFLQLNEKRELHRLLLRVPV